MVLSISSGVVEELWVGSERALERCSMMRRMLTAGSSSRVRLWTIDLVRSLKRLRSENC